MLHLGFNMLALYFLGPMLEQVLGRLRFLAVYFVSAFTGSAAVMLLSNPNSQTLGASGAIFGLMGALVVVAFKVKADLRQILFWLGAQPGVHVLQHRQHLLGGTPRGLLGGALTAAIIVYAPRKRREVVQWTGIGLVLGGRARRDRGAGRGPRLSHRRELSPGVDNPVENYTRVTSVIRRRGLTPTWWRTRTRRP